MFDLKVINSVLGQLEEERGIPRDSMIETIESALATAYKKEYGKKGQVVRATFDMDTGKTEFAQVKTVVDETTVREDTEEEDGETAVPDDTVATDDTEEDERPRFDPEKHIYIADARRIKSDVVPGEELVFPLEHKDDYGRIAAQTAKQVIIQKIREAEKSATLSEYGTREGEIVSGTIQRIERGTAYIDLGRAVGIMPYDEQIPGERYRQGERVRAYLYRVEESARGVFLRLSRSHPEFLKKLFELEAPELSAGTIEIVRVARESGSRSKLAVVTHDEHIDPVGSLVGQRGVRVSTVMSELGGEKIDIIEYAEDPAQFIADALSPAKIVNVEINEEEGRALVEVTEDQQSLAIGRAGQNVRLAAKLTGWRIDIQSVGGEQIAEADTEGQVAIAENADTPEKAETESAHNASEDVTETETVEEETPTETEEGTKPEEAAEQEQPANETDANAEKEEPVK